MAVRTKTLASQAGFPRPQALVFGGRAVAGRIGDALAEEGYEVTLLEAMGWALPSMAYPTGFEELKRVLLNFRDSAGPAPSGMPHCVHPGVTHWADRPELALLGQELGLAVIMPPARVVSLFSNKLSLLTEAERLGIPHLVISFDPIQSVRELERLALPLPVVLKSTRGAGGGLGVRVIHEAADLKSSLSIWLEQLRQKLGESILFVERYVEGARHVLLPFARFGDGSLEFFPLVDASLQSRFRKVLEFCPFTELEKEAATLMETHCRNLGDATHFIGVGALEFLVDGPRVYLVDAMARLDTGFHLWETVAGTSAVSWQLGALTGRKPVRRQASESSPMGCLMRIYAEDCMSQLPQPGVIRELQAERQWKQFGAQAEFDLGYEAGQTVTFDSDGLIGILTLQSHKAGDLLPFAREVLSKLWIAGGIQTNERALSELLSHPWLINGIYHAGFMDEEFSPRLFPPPEVESAILEVVQTLDRFSKEKGTWYVGDRVLSRQDSQRNLHWSVKPQQWIEKSGIGLSGSLETAGGEVLQTLAFPLHQGRWLVRISNWFFTLRRSELRPKGKGIPLYSQLAGRVHSLLYREGSVIPAHEAIMTLESLQSLVPHAVPMEVKLLQWKVQPEQIVEPGQELAILERLMR